MIPYDIRPWDELRLVAQSYDDLQGADMAIRLRVIQAGGPEQLAYGATLDAITAAKKEAQRTVERCFRRVVPQPIRAWQKGAPGVGEHELGLLLGVIGHPAIAVPHQWFREADEVVPDHICSAVCGKGRHLVPGEPYYRTLGQLRAYCGMGDPARRRAKGMSEGDAMALGQPRAKTQVWRIVGSCIKTASLAKAEPVYADAYRAARARYETDRQEWSKNHQHLAAMRLAGKLLLRDLYYAARADLQEDALAA